MLINWIIFQKFFDNIYHRGGGAGVKINGLISERMTGVFGRFLHMYINYDLTEPG